MKRVVVRKIRGGEAAVQRELELLQLLRDERHVLRFVDAWFDEEKAKTYLVTRFVDGESLAALLKRNGGPLVAPQTQHYFRQLFVAIDCLQKHRIAHRDIKPDNVLLSPSHQLTLIDFGVALLVGTHDPANAATGSAAYHPPEKMTAPDTADDFDADVWAAGLCLYQACTGVHPFEQCAPSAMFDRIARADIDFSPIADERMLSVLHKLLARDPKQRCSARWARKHAFVVQSDSAASPKSQRRARKQWIAPERRPPTYDDETLQRLEAFYRTDVSLVDRNGGAASTPRRSVAGIGSDDDSLDAAIVSGDADSDWQPAGRHSVVASPRQSIVNNGVAAATAAAAAVPTTPSGRKKSACIIV